MTVTLYRSTDVGAPDMSNKPSTVRGDLITLLKAVLVDGYGAQVSAGWTMPFEDVPNNVAVFRNSDVGSGTGTYFRVDDNIHYQYAEIRGFQNMTDVNTGTGEFPSTPQAATGPFFGKRLYQNHVPSGAWSIIACERGLYYNIHMYGSTHYVSNGTNGHWYFGFLGDIVSYIGSDPYSGCIAGENTTSQVDEGHSCFDYHDYLSSDKSEGKYLAGDHTGFVESQRYAHFSNISMTGQWNPGGSDGYLQFPDPITARTIFGKVYIGHSNGIRGEYPGMVLPYNFRSLTVNQNLPDEGVFVGQDWWAMPCKPSQYLSIYCIRYNCDTSVWYDV